MKVAFIGLGQMGAPMATHVAAAGFDITIHDVRAEAMAELVAAGATAAAGPVAAARGADLVCVVVSTDDQVLEVVSRDLVSATAEGAVIVIHATVGLDTIAEVARRCDGAGRICLDVGISGGEFGAKEGTLVLMAGGDEDTLDRVRPALATYASEIFHLGDTGAGMTVKLARNLVGYAMMAAIHDGQVLVEAAGVDLGRFKEILDATNLEMMTGFVAGRSTTTPAPLDTGRHDGARGIVEIGHKDLAMAHAAAAKLGVEAATAAAAQRLYAAVLGLDIPVDPDLAIDPSPTTDREP